MGRKITEGIDFTDGDIVDSLDVMYDNVQKELALFIQEKITEMKQYTEWTNRKDLPPPGIIGKALMTYPHIMWALIALHGQARVEKDVAQSKYDFIYSDLYAKTKQEEIAKGKAGFTQAKDLENLTKSRNAEKLGKLNADIILAESKYNFANYLVDSWKDHQWTLNNLTKLTLADEQAAHVEQKHPMERFDD